MAMLQHARPARRGHRPVGGHGRPVSAEAFAGRLASGQQQRGAVVRLPADGVVDLVAAAGLAFVSVDLVDGPFDEISLHRLVSAAHLAGLGVVARIDDSSIATRAVASGVDALDPRDVEVVVTDALSVSAATAPLTAVDIDRAIATSLTAFADAQPPSPVTLVMLPGMLGDPTLYYESRPCWTIDSRLPPCGSISTTRSVRWRPVCSRWRRRASRWWGTRSAASSPSKSCAVRRSG